MNTTFDDYLREEWKEEQRDKPYVEKNSNSSFLFI